MKSTFFLLVLSTFLLLPFVTFSSSFTFHNPIVLPTTPTYNNNGSPVQLFPAVEDENGDALEVGAEYLMYTSGGPGIFLMEGVYLTRLDEDSDDSKCPNAVVHEDARAGDFPDGGMPVKFIPTSPDPSSSNVVRQIMEINIMFSIPNTSSCADETVWNVADPDLTADGRRFIVTGGRSTIENNNRFELFRFLNEPRYQLLYCPARLEDGSCDYQIVSVAYHNGKPQLCLAKYRTDFLVMFRKVKK